MNRRSFFRSIVATVPAIALPCSVKQGPVSLNGLGTSMGKSLPTFPRSLERMWQFPPTGNEALDCRIFAARSLEESIKLSNPSAHADNDLALLPVDSLDGTVSGGILPNHNGVFARQRAEFAD